MIVFKLFMMVLLLIVVPFIIGYGYLQLTKVAPASFSISVVFGNFVVWALFGATCIPLILMQKQFGDLVTIYSILLVVICVVSVVLSFCKVKELIDYLFSYWSKRTWLSIFVFVAVILLILSQIFLMHSDADDAEYVAIATAAIQKNALLNIDAYTGNPASETLLKRVIAPFALWWAYGAKVVGVHPAIFCHTIFPAFMILYTFWLYTYMGDFFFKKNALKTEQFLLVVYTCMIFGGYSTFSLGARLLMRGWQGKSVLAAYGLPLLFLLICQYILKPLSLKLYIAIFIFVLGCTSLTTMSDVLVPLMLGAFSLVQLIRKQSVVEFIKWVSFCIPCAIFVLIQIVG